MNHRAWPILAILLSSASALGQTVDGTCPASGGGNLGALCGAVDEAAHVVPPDPRKLLADALACQKIQSSVADRPLEVGPVGLLSFRSGLAIDADGAPNAYGPNGLGLDNLANAGSPGHWWGIATGTNGEPVVQGPGDPFPGYYVSTTSLENPDFAESDPRRYVDSTKIPFIVLPPELLGSESMQMGDLAAVEYDGHFSFAIVADQGPRNKLGEGSIALADALGINSDARRGGLEEPRVRMMLFPGTGSGRPLTKAAIDSMGAAALATAAQSCSDQRERTRLRTSR